MNFSKNVKKLLSYLSETIKKLSKIANYRRCAKCRYRKNDVTLSDKNNCTVFVVHLLLKNYNVPYLRYKKSHYMENGVSLKRRQNTKC